MDESKDAAYPCPACGATLFGWTAAHDPLDRAKRIVLDRCEACRLAVTRGIAPPDPDPEIEALLEQRGDGSFALAAPNIRSIQGGIGGAQWAGLEPELRRLHLTPDSISRLLAMRGLEVERIRTPYSRASLRAMRQTLINAFTLRDNFLRNARSGRVDRHTGTDRFAYWLDWIVTVLVWVPVAVVAWPLERIGAWRGRGGILELVARPIPGAVHESG